MSAAEETTRRGDATAAAADDAHLRQPNDAVPMDDLPRAPDASPPEDAPRQHPLAASQDARPPSSSDCRAEGQDEPTIQRQVSAAPSSPSSTSSSKGKERDGGPAIAAAEAVEAAEGAASPSKEDDSESSMAIGPAQDEIKAAPGGPGSGPVCNLTLLLTSGGRHPYRIDAKYLGRRNVAIPDLDQDGNPDPFSISIYTLKELILREWRADWEAKPASPTSIRLIYFGKLLDDKEQLKTYQFSSDNPNVVHMSIRPQDLDDEEPKTGNKSLPTGPGSSARARDGRCCVIL